MYIAFTNKSRQDICEYFEIDPNAVFNFAIARFKEHIDEYDEDGIETYEKILCAVADVYINGILTGVSLGQKGKKLP